MLKHILKLLPKHIIYIEIYIEITNFSCMKSITVIEY